MRMHVYAWKLGRKIILDMPRGGEGYRGDVDAGKKENGEEEDKNGKEEDFLII